MNEYNSLEGSTGFKQLYNKSDNYIRETILRRFQMFKRMIVDIVNQTRKYESSNERATIRSDKTEELDR